MLDLDKRSVIVEKYTQSGTINKDGAHLAKVRLTLEIDDLTVKELLSIPGGPTVDRIVSDSKDLSGDDDVFGDSLNIKRSFRTYTYVFWEGEEQIAKIQCQVANKPKAWANKGVAHIKWSVDTIIDRQELYSLSRYIDSDHRATVSILVQPRNQKEIEYDEAAG